MKVWHLFGFIWLGLMGYSQTDLISKDFTKVQFFLLHHKASHQFDDIKFFQQATASDYRCNP